MKVLFIHENTMGHTSYLPQFVNHFVAHPELGIIPEMLYATPLPAQLAAKADKTIPFLRRFGLDLHFSRWRKVVSKYVRDQVRARPAGSFDAIVINTQSIALDLIDVSCPLFVALDATFHQLTRSRWFSDPPLPNIAPRLVSSLIEREKKLFHHAKALLPWSHTAAQSISENYKIPSEGVHVLPPSLEIPPQHIRTKNKIPRALFIGADFNRKGGNLLLEAGRAFKGRFELHIVTQSDVSPQNGVHVHRNIRAHTAEWRMLWNESDFFVFPSQLETFGIVLVEALAFEVPVIASRAGAAEEILDHGKAGLLLDSLTVGNLVHCIESILTDSTAAKNRASIGRRRAETEFNLTTNGARLAQLLLHHR